MNKSRNSLKTFIGIFILLISCSFSVQAQNWIQIGKDIDGEAAGDHSGGSVSLNSSGDIVAIGARHNDGNGGQSGHVRIYEWDGSIWNQRGTDIDGEGSDNNSGNSVSLSSTGDIVAIGAIYNNDAGHVRVYKWDGGSWAQRGSDIDGEAANDGSGVSVSLNSTGDIVAIGAYLNDGNGDDAGHVRIYEWDGGSWVQRGSDIDGEAALDYLGISVSLNKSGNVVAIGADENDGNGEDAGHVRIYEWNGSAWIQKGLDIDGEAALDHLGISVSLDSIGGVVAIGANLNDGNGSIAGHVRVYEWNGSVWSQRGSDIDGEDISDHSGWSVSLNNTGDVVAIGAKYNDVNSGDLNNNTGHVRIYEWNGSVWSQRGSDIDGEDTGDLSGFSVSLNSTGDIVAIGANNNDGNGDGAGQVRVFARDNISTEILAFDHNDIYIYPNPINSTLNIESTGNSDRYYINITSISGQPIFREHMAGTSHQVDLSTLQRGVYIISIKSGNFVTTKKIIKL